MWWRDISSLNTGFCIGFPKGFHIGNQLEIEISYWKSVGNRKSPKSRKNGPRTVLDAESRRGRLWEALWTKHSDFFMRIYAKMSLQGSFLGPLEHQRGVPKSSFWDIERPKLRPEGVLEEGPEKGWKCVGFLVPKWRVRRGKIMLKCHTVVKIKGFRLL